MNIAFPALIIVLLLLPGIVFRYAYSRGSWGWTSPVSFRSISDELAYSAIFAVALHALWTWLVGTFGYHADIDSLIAFLTGNFGRNEALYSPAIKSISDHSPAIAAYFLSLTGTAAIGGRVSHFLVRRLGLDRSTQILRFKNEWYYLLSGEVLSFAETPHPRDVDGVFLSAVVDHGNDSYLYRGIVLDWSFDGEGNLENVRLALAHRRKLHEDRVDWKGVETGQYIGPDERYYEIRGDVFILRYAEMSTINLDYFQLAEEVVAAESAESPSASAEEV